MLRVLYNILIFLLSNKNVHKSVKGIETPREVTFGKHSVLLGNKESSHSPPSVISLTSTCPAKAVNPGRFKLKPGWGGEAENGSLQRGGEGSRMLFIETCVRLSLARCLSIMPPHHPSGPLDKP